MSYCDDVRQFSSSVYTFLTRVFNHRLGFSELGLTDHFLLHLTECEDRYRLGQVEIYKTTWPEESRWGNDINLYIQNHSGRYDYFALQAKVMSYNGAYEDLKWKPNAGQQQWEALMNHERTYGSKAYYLLYTGQSQRHPGTPTTRVDCLGLPLVHELGLAIVEVGVVAHIRENTLRRGQKFYFRNVFPDHVDSIRKLFCCSTDIPRTPRQVMRSEIDTKGYVKVISTRDSEAVEDNISDGDREEVVKEVQLENGQAPVLVIVNLDQRA